MLYFFGLLKEKKSYEIESTYLVLARDGLKFEEPKLFRARDELSRTYF